MRTLALLALISLFPIITTGCNSTQGLVDGSRTFGQGICVDADRLIDAVRTAPEDE